MRMGVKETEFALRESLLLLVAQRVGAFRDTRTMRVGLRLRNLRHGRDGLFERLRGRPTCFARDR